MYDKHGDLVFICIDLFISTQDNQIVLEITDALLEITIVKVANADKIVAVLKQSAD